MIEITPTLSIPDDELTFETGPSSGPGGQNVNKVETRVTLLFDLAASPSLDDEQRALITEALATRINRHGVLRVSSQRHRSQAANREEVVERFADLLRQALTRDPERRPTRKPRAVARRRLKAKRQRSQTKKLRSRTDRWEE